MKRFLILGLCIFLLGGIKAQNNFVPDEISASYFGELGIYSGFRLSGHYTIAKKTKQKKKGHSIIKQNQLIPSVMNFGMAGGQKNWMIGLDFERTRFSKRGRSYRMYQVGLFANSLINSGTTYSSSNGVLEQNISARWYLSPKVSFGMGKLVAIGTRNYDFAIMPTAFFRLPYNHISVLPSFALEIRIKRRFP